MFQHLFKYIPITVTKFSNLHDTAVYFKLIASLQLLASPSVINIDEIHTASQIIGEIALSPL
jgi:Holliday junction resolvasome RuvABC ATP-dependent DNA helicase subunit